MRSYEYQYLCADFLRGLPERSLLPVSYNYRFASSHIKKLYYYDSEICVCFVASRERNALYGVFKEMCLRVWHFNLI